MIIEVDSEIESCVYKLWHGPKYLIIKGKNLASSIFLFEKGYAYFVGGGGGVKLNHTGEKSAEFGKGQQEWDGVNSYYYQFYKWIYDNPELKSRVEVLIESNNAYELLKREQIELQNAIRDKNCLNRNVTAYIPKYRAKTKSYGWINKGSVLAFKKYLKMA